MIRGVVSDRALKGRAKARTLAACAGLAFGAWSGAASAAPQLVWLANGAGFLVQGPEGCVLVTASHVLGDDVDVSYRTAAGSGRATVVWSDPNLDVAIARLEAAQTGCPAAPSSTEADRALETPVGQIVSPTESGNDRIAAVQLTGRTNASLTIRPMAGATDVGQGQSGSPVTFNGVLVGMLLRSGDDGAKAVRLDYLAYMEGADRWLRPRPAQPSASPASAFEVLPSRATEDGYIVYFAFDSYALTLSAQEVIRRAAEDGQQESVVKVLVTGYVDSLGSSAYNVRLSERCAKAVADALVAGGVPQSKLSVDWKGETEPAVDFGDGVAEPRNRRTTIVYTRNPGAAS